MKNVCSLHGLVRGENMELGRDSDTGGQVWLLCSCVNTLDWIGLDWIVLCVEQVKYVVELARALAATKGVYRVDLLTRQISSPEVDSTYGEPVEMLTRAADAADGCGAYIIRLPCGPRDRRAHHYSYFCYLFFNY